MERKLNVLTPSQLSIHGFHIFRCFLVDVLIHVECFTPPCGECCFAGSEHLPAALLSGIPFGLAHAIESVHFWWANQVRNGWPPFQVGKLFKHVPSGVEKSVKSWMPCWMVVNDNQLHYIYNQLCVHYIFTIWRVKHPLLVLSFFKYIVIPIHTYTCIPCMVVTTSCSVLVQFASPVC